MSKMCLAECHTPSAAKELNPVMRSDGVWWVSVLLDASIEEQRIRVASVAEFPAVAMMHFCRPIMYAGDMQPSLRRMSFYHTRHR
jgi:hypothetical protein